MQHTSVNFLAPLSQRNMISLQKFATTFWYLAAYCWCIACSFFILFCFAILCGDDDGPLSLSNAAYSW